MRGLFSFYTYSYYLVPKIYRMKNIGLFLLRNYERVLFILAIIGLFAINSSWAEWKGTLFSVLGIATGIMIFDGLKVLKDKYNDKGEAK